MDTISALSPAVILGVMVGCSVLVAAFLIVSTVLLVRGRRPGGAAGPGCDRVPTILTNHPTTRGNDKETGVTGVAARRQNTYESLGNYRSVSVASSHPDSYVNPADIADIKVKPQRMNTDDSWLEVPARRGFTQNSFDSVDRLTYDSYNSNQSPVCVSRQPTYDNV